MKGDLLPASDHVVRLCGGSHVGDDGKVSASAFKVRTDEAYLSVNWLEVLHHSNQPSALSEIRKVLATKRKVGTTARLALLNVGSLHALAATNNGAERIEVVHEPEISPPDASHSGIYRVLEDDAVLHRKIAKLVLELHPATARP
jgi:hypothetical protein